MEGRTMEIIRFVDAPAYTLPNHDDVTARRLQGGEATTADFALVGYSEFPPGAIVPMEAAPIGKIYVVAQGTISIEQANGVRHGLQQWDSIFVPAGEARAVLNDTSEPAAIIVITPSPAR
jgi:quercetin dioxygenase-like cupin family protein